MVHFSHRLRHDWQIMCVNQLQATVENVTSRQWQLFSAKLHNTGTGYGHVYNTTNGRATTILQRVVQQIHHQRTKICHIPTSGHVEMLGSGVAMWQICCTTSCRVVVSLSVGVVVQHVRGRSSSSGVWHLFNHCSCKSQLMNGWSWSNVDFIKVPYICRISTNNNVHIVVL